MATIVPMSRRRGEPDTLLEPLVALVQDDMDRVNTAIIEQMQSPVQLIPRLAGHLIAAGGKRLRPMLTIGAGQLCGYTGDRLVPLAACVEFIHTATLLHDDVVDGSDLRRGLDSANTVWGNKASVLVGDFLFSRAFQLMVADGSLRVLKVLSDASAIIAEGEVRQLAASNNTRTEEIEYLRVIEAKTAALFSAAVQIAAVVADRPGDEEDALVSFGLNLGLAFQLVDDALDYSARQAELGKRVGDDMREGKITLPVILAFRRGTEEERRFWCRTMEDLEQEDGDFDRAQALMRRHGAIEDTVARARHHASIARDALGLFPDSPALRALVDVISFCVTRDY